MVSLGDEARLDHTPPGPLCSQKYTYMLNSLKLKLKITQAIFHKMANTYIVFSADYIFTHLGFQDKLCLQSMY